MTSSTRGKSTWSWTLICAYMCHIYTVQIWCYIGQFYNVTYIYLFGNDLASIWGQYIDSNCLVIEWYISVIKMSWYVLFFHFSFTAILCDVHTPLKPCSEIKTQIAKWFMSTRSGNVFIISTDWNLKRVVNRKQPFQTFLGYSIPKGLYTNWQLCTSNSAHFRPLNSCSWNKWFLISVFHGPENNWPGGTRTHIFQLYAHIPNSWFRILAMAV